jgi:hypothetical protein
MMTSNAESSKDKGPQVAADGSVVDIVDNSGSEASNDHTASLAAIPNEKIIYDKLCSVYPNEIKSITELSKNTTGQRDFLVSPVSGFDFDNVMNWSDKYPSVLNEKSPDALFYHNSTLYFIEFKEGDCNKIDVRTKIHEGINTLYNFVVKHLPQMTRKEFFNLNINYGVFARDIKATVQNSTIRATLANSSQKFNLRNLEGMIIKRTRYSTDPQYMVNFLNKITSGGVSEIEVFEYLQQPSYTRFQVTP